MTRRLRTVRLCSLTAVVALVLLASGCSLLREFRRADHPGPGDQRRHRRATADQRQPDDHHRWDGIADRHCRGQRPDRPDVPGDRRHADPGQQGLDRIAASISYALTVGPLDRLEVSGSGNASGIGTLRGDSTVLASGSGSVELTGLAMTGVVVDLSGSGGVTLGGTADTQQVTLSGSGGYDGSGLITAEADVEVDGSGSARVQVTGRLSATVNGSGDITYTGNPPQVDRSTSGSGDIVPGLKHVSSAWLRARGVHPHQSGVGPQPAIHGRPTAELVVNGPASRRTTAALSLLLSEIRVTRGAPRAGSWRPDLPPGQGAGRPRTLGNCRCVIIRSPGATWLRHTGSEWALRHCPPAVEAPIPLVHWSCLIDPGRPLVGGTWGRCRLRCPACRRTAPLLQRTSSPRTPPQPGCRTPPPPTGSPSPFRSRHHHRTPAQPLAGRWPQHHRFSPRADRPPSLVSRSAPT